MPVDGLVGLSSILGVALQAPVDDVDGGAEAGPDPIFLVHSKHNNALFIRIRIRIDLPLLALDPATIKWTQFKKILT